MVGDGVLDAGVFLSTPSARRATRQARSGRQVAQDISIHALREEGDLLNTLFSPFGDGFLSTPSARRATISSGVPGAKQFLFLSTPSARRATGTFAGLLTCPRYFYPRPPRGGRHSIVVGVDHMADISIHALREEGDRDVLPDGDINIQFLSTPSARRATWHWRHCRNHRPISIHALREEGDVGFLFRLVEELYISIHALREEGDGHKPGLSPQERISIHALREEGDFPILPERFSVYHISIHALREEGDRPGVASSSRPRNFYPRPPRGGRPEVCTRNFC